MRGDREHMRRDDDVIRVRRGKLDDHMVPVLFTPGEARSLNLAIAALYSVRPELRMAPRIGGNESSLDTARRHLVEAMERAGVSPEAVLG